MYVMQQYLNIKAVLVQQYGLSKGVLNAQILGHADRYKMLFLETFNEFGRQRSHLVFQCFLQAVAEIVLRVQKQYKCGLFLLLQLICV